MQNRAKRYDETRDGLEDFDDMLYSEPDSPVCTPTRWSGACDLGCGIDNALESLPHFVLGYPHLSQCDVGWTKAQAEAVF